MDSQLFETFGINITKLIEFFCSTKGVICIAAGFTAAIAGKYLFRKRSVRRTWNKTYDFIIGKYVH